MKQSFYIWPNIPKNPPSMQPPNPNPQNFDHPIILPHQFQLGKA